MIAPSVPRTPELYEYCKASLPCRVLDANGGRVTRLPAVAGIDVGVLEHLLTGLVQHQLDVDAAVLVVVVAHVAPLDHELLVGAAAPELAPRRRVPVEEQVSQYGYDAPFGVAVLGIVELVNVLPTAKAKFPFVDMVAEL